MNTDPEKINGTDDLETLLAASRPAAPRPPAAFRSALRRRLLDTQIPPRRAWLPKLNLQHGLLNLAGFIALVVLLALAFLFIPKLQPQPAATQTPPEPTDTVAPQPTVAPTQQATLAPTPSPYDALPEGIITADNFSLLQEVVTTGKGFIQGIAVSPDGEWLAVASTYRYGIYDAKTLNRYRAMELNWPVYAVAFSPDSQTLAAGGQRAIYFFPRTGMFWAYPENNMLEIDLERVEQLLYSPDGKWLLAASRRDTLNTSAYLVELATQRIIPLPPSTSFLYSAAFSADSKRLIQFRENGLYTFDLETLKSGKAFLLQTTYLKDGAVVAGVCGDEYRAELGLGLKSTNLATSGNLLTALCGNQVVLFEEEKAIQWSDTSPELAVGEENLAFAASPDGIQLAVSFHSVLQGDKVLLWNTADLKQPPQMLAANGELTKYLAYGADHRTLFTADDSTVRRWDTQTGAETGVLPYGQVDPYEVPFRIRQAFTNPPTDPAHQPVISASLDQDMSIIGGGGYRRAVMTIRRQPDGELVKEIDLGDGDVVFPVIAGPVISPDGQHVLVGVTPSGGKSSLRIYRADGSLQQEIENDGYWSLLAFSPDGSLLAAQGNGVYLWQVGTGLTLTPWNSESGNAVLVPDRINTQLIFSPDSKTLIVNELSSQSVRLVDTVTGEEKMRLRPNAKCESIERLLPSAAANVLLGVCTAGNEGADTYLTMWELKKGKLVGTLYLDTFRATSASLSLDGKYLRVDYEDGRNVYYTAPDIALVRQALAAAYQPEDTQTFPSPDGAWNAAFTVQGCLTVGDRDWTSTRLTLEPVNGGEPLVVLDILDWCGLGGTHYFVVAWSPNSRYLYYGRGVIPDGWWCFDNRFTIIQVDTTNGAQTTIGPSGPLSPDGTRFAWRSGNDIALWSLDSGLEKRLPVPLPNLKTLNLYWSPDGAWLYLLQNEGECPDTFGAGALVRINLASGAGEVLLDSPDRAFLYLEWLSADVLRLTDSEDIPWLFDLTTRQWTRE